MGVEYRPLRDEDLEQAAYVESVAFYNEPTPERLETLRRVFPPDWTDGAFVDGRLVAVVRVIPMARRMNGRSARFGCVGPVACLAEHRRQGHVGRLLRRWLERMRDQGMPLSGLHTPHDALYQRYGWERAEAKKRYHVRAKDVSLRMGGAPGRLEHADPDDWQRLEEVYRPYAGPRNGPLHRPELWWREAVFREYDSPKVRDGFVWLSSGGEAQGFVVYTWRGQRWHPLTGGDTALLVRDMVSLTPDAYLGLWQHLLGHDLARPIAVDAPLDDPFPDLVDDPWKVEVQRAEGAMIRIVDVEHALSTRAYVGEGAVAFTLRVADASAPWNDGVWRIEAGEGRMQAQRVQEEADLEVSVNFLAPLFTGHIRADHAAEVGMLKVNRPEALADAKEAFAVTYPPYCNDWY